LGGTTWKTDKSILEMWQGQELESLRESFLNNEKKSICNRCWQEEFIGKDSLRLRMLKEYTVDFKNYKSSPKILSIKNGNICNAKCRSCHPEDSTPWIQDANKLHQITKKNFYSLNYEPNNWSDDQVTEIIKLLPHLERLELYGGEPLYNKKVIQILQSAIDSGESQHITLYVNTNGSVNLIDKLPNIKFFKHFDICVSIDALDEQFFYVRHPLNYNEVVKNIKQWQKYFHINKVSYSMKPIVTVSILNILSLPEIKKRLTELFKIEPFWILLTNPSHLCISNLPEETKKYVIDKLNVDDNFNDLINFMQQNKFQEQSFRDFFEIIDGMDKIRNENFSKTFPELFNLLNPYRLEPFPLPVPPPRSTIEYSSLDVSENSETNVLTGISLFVGDTQKNKENVREETFKYVNRTPGDNFPIYHIKGNKNNVVVTDVDNTHFMLPSNELPHGIYFTGLSDWDNEDSFDFVKSQAKNVIYFTKFLGINLFIGDTKEDIELVRHKTFKYVNQNPEDDFPICHISGNKDTVTITEVDGIQFMLSIKELPHGIYFTGKDDWDSLETFEYIKSQAKILVDFTILL
jgi:hypothetical protein